MKSPVELSRCKGCFGPDFKKIFAKNLPAVAERDSFKMLPNRSKINVKNH
jgi:hypothetical protein